jgi:hypothetical protein
MGRLGDTEWGDRVMGDTEIRRWGDWGMRRLGDEEIS